MIHSFKDKIVLITGASSGIGEATAWAFAQKGAKVVLLARRFKKLVQIQTEMQSQGLSVFAIQGDVTQEASLLNAVKKIHNQWGLIDIVIANAGFSLVGTVESLSLIDFKRQFDTNVYGVLNTFYATIKDLKSTQGNLVLLGSIAGYISIPRTAPYSMSKFAIRALADSLYSECGPSNVAVTLITPGYVKSEIRNVNNQGEYQVDAADPIPPWLRISSESAAIEILKATLNRERERVITAHGKLALFLNWILPGMITRVMRFYYQFRAAV